MYNYDVTVLVCSFNPELEKILFTLKSILLQKKISIQILITDDGSITDYFEEIESFLKENRFSDYILHKNRINMGTVNSICSVVELAEGKWIKTISPGDMLYRDTCLFEWIEDTEKKKGVCSIADAIYFKFDSFYNISLCCEKANPQCTKYTNKEKMKIGYLIYNDTALGAAVLCRKDIFLNYMMLIKNRIIYAEDFILRIMIFCGEEIVFFDQNTILYEYGTGISTSGQKEWKEKLEKDLQESNQIIIKMNVRNSDYFMRKFHAKIEAAHKKSIKNRIVNLLVNPDRIIFLLYRKFRARMTDTTADRKYLLALKDISKNYKNM